MELFKITPGKKTTENYYTLAGSVLSLAIAMGWISPDLSHTIVQAGDTLKNVDLSNINSIVDGAIRVIALFMGGNMITSYIKARGQVKAQVGKGQNLTEDTDETNKDS